MKVPYFRLKLQIFRLKVPKRPINLRLNFVLQFLDLSCQLLDFLVLLIDPVLEYGLGIIETIIYGSLQLLSVSLHVFYALEELVSVSEHEAQLGVKLGSESILQPSNFLCLVHVALLKCC